MPKAAKAVVKKKQNGYKMPDPLPQGEILKDMVGNKWKLGPSIGKGGFGEIYAAQECNKETPKKKSFPYVIKIEPHANGPLFVEMHFFMRNGKKADIDSFISSKKLKTLGMPVYHGSGSHDVKDTKYRFVVMERFGSDIWKIFLDNKKIFNPLAVYKVGIQILDVLEYIHSKGYVHADIKGANILLGSKDKNQVYLVDFGLAVHYTTSNDFKPDPKKAHDGTIEYLSRDAHQGVPTRRGDLEILIYNLIQWLGCTLPWENNIKDPMAVKASKEKYMADIPLFMKTCFGSKTPPGVIVDLLKYHKTLKFNSEINYDKARKILESGLHSAGGSVTSPLSFKMPKSPSKRKSDSETPLSGKKMKISRRKLLDSCTEETDQAEDDVQDSDELEGVGTVSPASRGKNKNDTPKRRGRRGAVKKVVQEIDSDKDQVDNEGDNKDGYTSEMRRIMEKIEVTKKDKRSKRQTAKKLNLQKKEMDVNPSTSTTPVRRLRSKRQINYKDRSRNSSGDEDVIPASDDE